MEKLVWKEIKERNVWPDILKEKIIGKYFSPSYYQSKDRLTYNCPIHGNFTRMLYDVCVDITKTGNISCPKCSRISGRSKAKETNMERYGAPTPAQNATVLDKMKKTNMKRYGYETAGGNPEFMEKIKSANMEKYGVEHAIMNTDVRAKRDETMLEKYGTVHALQNEDSMNKFKSTMNENYGANYALENDILKNKHWDSMEEKYGTKHALQVPEFKEKMNNTNFDRYNSNSVSSTYDGYCKIQYSKGSTPTSEDNWNIINDKELLKAYILKLTIDEDKPSLKDISTSIGFSISTTGHKIMIHDLGNLVHYLGGESYAEYEIMEFLDEYNIKYIHRYHKGKNEIDVFMPDYKVGIEFNGIYWHSDTYKDKDYHIQKKKYFNEHDISIINVYEDEWLDDHGKDIIKSIILSSCNISTDKTILYARKLKVVELDHDIYSLQKVRDFYETNHLQGYRQSAVHIALVDGVGDIMECMSFGHSFFGNKGNPNRYQFELIRHCTKIYMNVVGGKERIFKDFLTKHPKNSNFEYYLVTYCDVDKFSGKSYLDLGFKYVSSSPQAWGVLDNNKRVNRNPNNNAEFKDLPKIYGCGNDKYVYD